ncbi:conserved hypothetical protein [Trichinella spiralis]|uniref:hypothetical protein n=1 Tax=Trichinella spiralis TaxID=6334 RepID=UPI0001EFBFD0|nr:conserved hypothetical protein [Trichinella spiralis]
MHAGSEAHLKFVVIHRNNVSTTVKTTYRLTISDIEEVTSSYFLTDDLHINYYEDNILKSRSSSWKSNNDNFMIFINLNTYLFLLCYYDLNERSCITVYGFVSDFVSS